MKNPIIAKSLGNKLETATNNMIGHAESAIQFSITVGNVLIEGKKQIPHGEFQDWADKFCSINKRQRQKCMQLAEAVASKRVKQKDVVKLGSINEAVKSIPKLPKPPSRKSAPEGAFESIPAANPKPTSGDSPPITGHSGAVESSVDRQPGDESEEGGVEPVPEWVRSIPDVDSLRQDVNALIKRFKDAPDLSLIHI